MFKPEQVNHDFHWLLVMGRLKPGVTLKQAQQNMDSVTAHIAEVYPKSDKGWGSYVEGLKNDFLPKERIKMLWLLLGAVGFRAADCLRQRRQSAAGTRHGTAERNWLFAARSAPDAERSSPSFLRKA